MKIKKCLMLDKHKSQGKRVEKCVLCGVKVGLSFMERLREKIDLVPHEKKQELLNELRNGTIGEAIKKVDPKGEHESIVWFNIINDNISSYKYLNEKAI